MSTSEDLHECDGEVLSSSEEECAERTGNDVEQEKGAKKEKQEQSAAESGVWKMAVCPHSHKTYYYHSRTRETQWRKPIELATKEERKTMMEKERRQKEFFAAMEANILKSISQGVKIPEKKNLWEQGGRVEGVKDIEKEKKKEKEKEKERERERKKKEAEEEREKNRFNLVRTISTMDSSILRELIVRVPSTKNSQNRVDVHAMTTEPTNLTTRPVANNSSASSAKGTHETVKTDTAVEHIPDNPHPQRRMSLTTTDLINFASGTRNSRNESMDLTLLTTGASRGTSGTSALDSSFGWGNVSNFSFYDESMHNFGLSNEESMALDSLAKISKQMTLVSQDFDDFDDFDSPQSDHDKQITKRASATKGKNLGKNYLDKMCRMDSELPEFPDIQGDEDGDVSSLNGLDPEGSKREEEKNLGKNPLRRLENSFMVDFGESGEIQEFESDDFGPDNEEDDEKDEVESSMPEMEEYELEDDFSFESDNDEQDVPAYPLKTSELPITITSDTAAGMKGKSGTRTTMRDVMGLVPLCDKPHKNASVGELHNPEQNSRRKNLKAKKRESKSYRHFNRDALQVSDHNQRDLSPKKEKRRSQLARRNTCSTLYVGTTMAAPDKDATIKCVCGVFRAHILQSEMLEDCYHPDMYKFRVFNDLASHQTSVAREDYHPSLDYDHSVHEPTLDEISIFYRDVFQRAHMEADCIIMSLIYVERLVKCTEGALRPRQCNWRSILFSCMVLSSKVWDDMSVWNADFSQTCPNGVLFTLKRINELEVALLSALQYKVKVTASEYAKYYFLMRSMLIKSGLVSDDVDSKSPLDVEGAKRLHQISAEYQSKKGGESAPMMFKRNSSKVDGKKKLDSRSKSMHGIGLGRDSGHKKKLHLENVVTM